MAFTASISEQVGNEHKQWLEGAAQAQAMLAKLDDQLKGLNLAPKPDASADRGNADN